VKKHIRDKLKSIKIGCPRKMQSSYMNKVNPNARQNNARHPEKQIDYYNIFRYYRNPAKES
jgi:hypothetical protein